VIAAAVVVFPLAYRTALDTYLRSQVEQLLIATLANFQGIALFVTHNLEEVFRVYPQIVVLAVGRAIAAGSQHDFFEHPGTVAAAQVTGCKNFSRALATATTAVWAEDWGCVLEVAGPIPTDLSQVGFRAHQFAFVEGPHRPNLALPGGFHQRNAPPDDAFSAPAQPSAPRRHRLPPAGRAV
jgi:molybdate transport system permease protein